MLINTDVNLPFSAIRLLQQGWHWLMPSSCLWCSLPVQSATHQLCTDCQSALPQLPYALCHYNLLWLPQVAQGLKKPRFDQLLSVSLYQHPYRHWLQRWKFFTDDAAGDLLQLQFAALLAQLTTTGQTLPDAIVYVPMHKARQRKRGFNQAQLLAQAAAEQLGLPLLHVIQKSRHLSAQVGLSRKQRKRNLRHSFTLNTTIGLPSHLALVDDVVTTGATANEICRLLRRHGVRRISVWTVAVTTLT
ncbi:MAG: ComF family protein [Gammaproteobacteria bacterium]|nr:ComF family protein [Gammaproteobacteria bacterium]MBU1553700.1 ComF family protein [Gammaproteobacteria bacterium]MBU2069410.1 ComF family protein [Gammaproteobacteria bacterium]MBU2182915.1 ComF family protein [Gammaproteobacteria bacterium]MBU2203263.1 ComF family protein [Gammaproteobacteria bacterium]